MHTDVLREIENFAIRFHTSPPTPPSPCSPPSTPPGHMHPPQYPPTPPPQSTPPPNVTPTPYHRPPAHYLTQPPALSLSSSVGDESYMEEEEDMRVQEEERERRRRRPSIERDISGPLDSIPENQGNPFFPLLSFFFFFSLFNYSCIGSGGHPRRRRSPILARKRTWRQSPNESDDAMVEMGVAGNLLFSLLLYFPFALFLHLSPSFLLSNGYSRQPR